MITVTHLKESVQLNHNRQLQEVVRSILEGSIPTNVSYSSCSAQLSLMKVLKAAEMMANKHECKNAILALNPKAYSNLITDRNGLRAYEVSKDERETHDFIRTSVGKTLIVSMPNMPEHKAFLIALEGDKLLEEKTIIQVGPVAIVHNKDYTLVDIDPIEVCQIIDIVNW